MTFYSFQFFAFLLLTATVYYTLSPKYRPFILLAASAYFYLCFKPEYLILLAVAIMIDFYLARHMEKSTGRKRKRLLILGLVHNIGLLALLKYLNFFSHTFRTLLGNLPPFQALENVKWLVPVGISYFTFKKISYLIDVYRETMPAEKKLLNLALYVSFFPSITAGPIDRAKDLIPQFLQARGFDYQKVTDGLKLMAWGFFKKVIIADNLAVFVNKVYDFPTQYEGLSLVMATIYFSIQIYCDFSGYTDIARGVAKILGYDLMENFDRPYFSTSIGEFWKRWHISLSNWLMEYLFLPTAYAVSRKIKKDRVLRMKAETWAYMTGIILTMTLCGIWHGASWTFVLWGTLHGLAMALSFATRKIRKKVNKRLKIKKNAFWHRLLQGIMTFSLVTVLWIFFRANSFSDAFYIVSHLFTGWAAIANPANLAAAIHLGLLKKQLAVAALSLGVVFLVHILRKEATFLDWLNQRKNLFRWAFYLLLVIWLIIFGDVESEQFIYFRF